MNHPFHWERWTGQLARNMAVPAGTADPAGTSKGLEV
ncbi:hypothetical protein BJ994_000407 [Arthrobacter pigmenti]|uniref:Uncharacterized protein n=1 Tax=Arthrobacter pigmenti TaxID=271432 RepID=A0A846RSP4_9MICC|nr:hypothetical protein [Arthrobacter pigmenti]